jgi:ubiquitin C-terminal hydrolase
MISNDREFELAIQWKPAAKAKLSWIENQVFKKVQLDSSESYEDFKHHKNSNTTIYECLQRFSQEEVLSGEDKWYCSSCNQHVSALKKIQIYKLPEYLIIHLKRFSHQRAS